MHIKSVLRSDAYCVSLAVGSTELNPAASRAHFDFGLFRDGILSGAVFQNVQGSTVRENIIVVATPNDVDAFATLEGFVTIAAGQRCWDRGQSRFELVRSHAAGQLSAFKTGVR